MCGHLTGCWQTQLGRRCTTKIALWTWHYELVISSFLTLRCGTPIKCMRFLLRKMQPIFSPLDRNLESKIGTSGVSRRMAVTLLKACTVCCERYTKEITLPLDECLLWKSSCGRAYGNSKLHLRYVTSYGRHSLGLLQLWSVFNHAVYILTWDARLVGKLQNRYAMFSSHVQQPLMYGD